MARREAKWRSDPLSLAGQSADSHRATASPSGRWTVPPHAGHRSGMTNSVSSPSRRLVITWTTLGMTSPPFSMSTQSPTRTSSRRTSSGLCRVARLTVEPSRSTGSNSATGVSAPVRPTWTAMCSTRVVACRAGYLYATAQRGILAVAPRRACSAAALTLTTTPSISKGRSGIRPRTSSMNASSSARSAHSRTSGLVLNPWRSSQCRVSKWVVSGAAPSTRSP